MTTDPMSSRLITAALFRSLGSSRWTLTRSLQSDNPLDLNGELRGTATFTALSNPSTSSPDREWLYSEEGEIPGTTGLGAAQAGLRWTKKYIWRANEENQISVWFVKVAPGPEEADYLFHNFDFSNAEVPTPPEGEENQVTFISPPTPPRTSSNVETAVLAARGNHLCINDMYRTAYAFRVRPDTGEVLSWASRHVVRGPKKDQEILNRYERED